LDVLSRRIKAESMALALGASLTFRTRGLGEGGEEARSLRRVQEKSIAHS